VNTPLAEPAWMPSTTTTASSFADDFRCPIGGRALVAVTGGEAAGFLHSQLSTDVRAMRVDDVALTSYSDAKGRLLAIMRLIATDSGFLLELPRDRAEAVMGQLQRYVLRADVHIEDVSASHAAFGAVGEEAAQCVTDVLPDLPPVSGTSRLLDDGARLMAARSPRASWMVIGPVESVRRAWTAFEALPAAPADWWEALEIEAGIPSVHEATAGRFVAQMVNLDRLDALDFRKGCYPGQEVIARTRYLGRIKRRMYLLRGTGTDSAPAPGDPVRAAGRDAPAGEIVRAGAHPDGGVIALAVLHSESAGAELLFADGSPASRRSLPYPLDEAA
jgi:folate-binding protein YgfZ